MMESSFVPKHYCKTTNNKEFLIILMSGKLNFSTVVNLSLTKCNLSQLPNCFKQLQVKYLDLSHNELKQIPNCFYSGLNCLENVDLSFNSLENWDISPNCVSTLKVLKVNNNKLYNVPLWIKTFEAVKLEQFVYSGNPVKSLKITSKTYPYPLVLRHLEMVNCYLFDDDFRFLKHVTTLQHLNISNNETGKMENSFRKIEQLFNSPKWKSMEILNLNNLTICCIPRNLCCIQTIRQLFLVNCHLSYFPPEFKLLSNLELIDCSHNGIYSLRQLVYLKQLKYVNASYNFVDFVPNFRLEYFDLYRNCLTTNDSYNGLIDSCDVIDLECNHFDTNVLGNVNYKQKCLDLRRQIDEDRSFGWQLDGSSDVEKCFHDTGVYIENSPICCIEEEWQLENLNDDFVYCDAD